jgi:hypothetical protein
VQPEFVYRSLNVREKSDWGVGENYAMNIVHNFNKQNVIVVESKKM